MGSFLLGVLSVLIHVKVHDLLLHLESYSVHIDVSHVFSFALHQNIAEGMTKSAEAVQAAEAGICQIGSLAHQQTIGMSYSFRQSFSFLSSC